ncbi:MAG: hypothetical protein ACE5HL_07760 [Terriglobia bacterium]
MEFRVLRYEHREPINIKMFVGYWLPPGTIIPCQIAKAWFPENGPDVAAALLRISDDYEAQFTHRLAINSYGPDEGDHVRAVGYQEMLTSDHLIDAEGITAQQTIDLPLKSTLGVVQHRYERGEHRLVKWPCFELNCSLDPGMSGGPIISIRDDRNVIACGVIASGVSYSAEGIASIIYPAMPIRIDASFPFLATKRPSLLDCTRKKMLEDVARAYNYLQPDGIWREFATPLFTISNHTEFRVAGGIMVDAERINSSSSEFSWLSRECVRLGQINRHNRDYAEYFLISSEFHAALLRAEEKHATASVEFVHARKPYIWLRVDEKVFRFFVFELRVESRGTIKILTDAKIDSPPPNERASSEQSTSE